MVLSTLATNLEESNLGQSRFFINLLQFTSIHFNSYYFLLFSNIGGGGFVNTGNKPGVVKTGTKLVFINLLTFTSICYNLHHFFLLFSGIGGGGFVNTGNKPGGVKTGTKWVISICYNLHMSIYLDLFQFKGPNVFDIIDSFNPHMYYHKSDNE